MVVYFFRLYIADLKNTVTVQSTMAVFFMYL